MIDQGRNKKFHVQKHSNFFKCSFEGTMGQRLLSYSANIQYLLHESQLRTSFNILHFITVYEISQLQAGLVYLPAGGGSIIGAYLAGKDPWHSAVNAALSFSSSNQNFSTERIEIYVFFNWRVASLGPILKHDYHLTARKHGMAINIEGSDDIIMFPIKEAQLRSI
jgi:hypothetical protein